MKKLHSTIAILLLICLSPGCRKTAINYVTQTGSTIPLLSIIKQSFSFSLFRYAIEKTGQDSIFSSGQPHTVFLPDNVAFNLVGINTTADLDRISVDSLRQLVRYHIVGGAIPTGDIPRTINSVYTNLDDMPLYVTNNGNTLRVNGDTVASLDVRASDGYIDILTEPLVLPWPSVKAFFLGSPNYSIVTAGLQNFGLLDQLDSSSPQGPYTVLAPTDAAFMEEGISLDDVNQMDTFHYKKLFFSAGIIPGTRIFLADFGDPTFATGYGGSYQLPYSNLTIIHPDYALIMESTYPPLSLYNWAVFDPASSALNPNYTGYTRYLGPNLENHIGLYQEGPQMTAGDNFCTNGVVHGLDDILIYPDSVSIQ